MYACALCAYQYIFSDNQYITRAQKFQEKYKHSAFEILDCVLQSYPKMSNAEKADRTHVAKPNRSRILQTQIVFWFARRILSNYTYRVLQTNFTMKKRRFFAVFRLFTKSCNTYRALSRFVEIRQNPIITQNFVRCPSQSRLSNPRCRIPSYTTIATELDKLRERASLTIGIRIDIS